MNEKYTTGENVVQISSNSFYFLKQVNTFIHQGHIKLISIVTGGKY